jgi:segregation and condensation protein A
MTLQEDYRVTLDAFQGPLDLLLFLIRRMEVDIHDIPVAEVTDQYLAFLHKVDDVDVDLAGEFLVMAASLIELKSRTLVPPETDEADGAAEAQKGADGRGAEDPRYELVQQLLAYQRYRIAAEELIARRHEFSQRHALRPGRDTERESEAEAVELELEDVHAIDLGDAYERIMASIDFARLGDHVVEIDDTPIALHQEDLLDRLHRAPEHALRLQDAFEGQTRGQRIGLFLATLELTRVRRISVVQDDIDADIQLVLINDPVPDEETPEAADPGSA